MLKLRGTSISLLFLLLSFFLMRTACRGRGRAKTTTSHELVFSFLFFFFLSPLLLCAYMCVCVCLFPALRREKRTFSLACACDFKFANTKHNLKRKKGKANCASDEMESSFESVLVYLQYRKRKKKRLRGIPHNLLIPRRFNASNRTLVRHKITRLSRSHSRVII